MSKYINRHVSTYTIHTSDMTIQEDGKPALTENKPITTNQNVTPVTALKLANKVLGKTDAYRVVMKIETSSELRGMTLDDFIKHSKPMKNISTPL